MLCKGILGKAISIHALCEEGDLLDRQLRQLSSRISIHALCEEGDLLHGVHLLCGVYFYPRPLRGGRREYPATVVVRGPFLSTPSARRATELKDQMDDLDDISIHALCEEGDWQIVCRFGQPLQFLSTPSARRATRLSAPGGRFDFISIHALCEEGDIRRCSMDILLENFYPRPLRGGRHMESVKNGPAKKISIHALCEEGDPNSASHCRGTS